MSATDATHPSPPALLMARVTLGWALAGRERQALLWVSGQLKGRPGVGGGGVGGMDLARGVAQGWNALPTAKIDLLSLLASSPRPL